MVRVAGLASTVIAALVSVAGAQPAASSAPAPHVRRGLFVRGQIGISSITTSWSEGPYGASLRGTGEAVSIAVGAALSPRWSLHAEAFDLTARDLRLRVSISGDGPVLVDAADKYALLGFGVGARHYLRGSDTYVSVTVAASLLHVTSKRAGAGTSHIYRTETSDLGAAVAVEVGHDWWLSPRSTLGVAGRLVFARVTDDPSDDTPTFDPTGVSLSLVGAYD